MNSQQILLALKERKITPEEAKRALTQNMKPKLSQEEIKIETKENLFIESGKTKSIEGSVLRKREEEPMGQWQCETPDYKDAVAIIGMSGRYPEADHLNQYWDNLVNARNSIKEIPKSRWDTEPYYDPRPSQKGKIYCKSLGVLDDIDCFDPLFFNISPTEAEAMDPQQRIFLQEGYKAFEDAGYNSQALNNKKCGVYLGIMSNEYGMLLYRNQGEVNSITGTSSAIAAARIPYFLNLKGPAIPVDTACSSSLVAAHLACQALLKQEIDMALVGGVTLYLTPQTYIGMCSAGMLSPDGQCKTFDNSADGFVPGEGVGALVLKRLQDAEADGDFIYGVIIGSGINQDGKTNGITAPSVNSQMELEREVYEKFRIDPQSIGYVEMHGTGTKLGDPIELEALSTVFKDKTDQRNYCAIGSVKSNIGHTSAAAGVASIHKILLCMQHKKLVPTLNFEKPNEHFDFSNSPFYVNTKLKEWEIDSKTPRRASVSSFGFSGTNAHMVIEEYIPKDRVNKTYGLNENKPVLFILSAKSEEQLKTYAGSMKEFTIRHENASLMDMAYTLQVGREAMEYRLAFQAVSRDALLKALEDFIHHRPSEGVFSGRVQKDGENKLPFGTEDIQAFIEKGELREIAKRWVNNLEIDWNRLYTGIKPRRIGLPTYPFNRERYWLPETKAETAEGPTPSLSTENIHPLLQRNTSDLLEQRFSSTFTGNEFFIRDHSIKGQRILPAAAYLEMVRAAVKKALGPLVEDELGIRIKETVWLKPIVVGEVPLEVHIRLFPEDDGGIAFQVYSFEKPGKSDVIVHSQGRTVLCEDKEKIELDLDLIKSGCRERTLNADECYAAFGAVGIEYGPAYRGMGSVFVGQEQVLAEVFLPPSVIETEKHFFLHPGLMDSALQASIGLFMGSGEEDTLFKDPALPFALQEVEFLGSCHRKMWSWIRLSPGSRLGDMVQKLDIDLCDGQGRVCVRIKGFSTRVLQEEERNEPDLEIQAPELMKESSGLPGVEFTQTGEDIPKEQLKEKTVHFLKRLLSSAIKLPIQRIEADVKLEKYGIDSILVMKLNHELEKNFKSLPKTLFFEYQSINALAEYFIQCHREQLVPLLGLEDKEGGVPSSQKKEVLPEPKTIHRGRQSHARFATPGKAQKKAEGGPLDIAIIGISGRYPGAENIAEFWNNLRDGKDCITEIPEERWDHSRYFDEDRDKPGKTYSKWGGFIKGVDQFDPLFFNISPREAEVMEPQERLFLECAFETLEDAGYTREELEARFQGNVGVYAGVMYEEYQLYAAQEQILGRPITLAGNPSAVSNRVSYFCNFHGPSMAVDTMCSSSLTAIHLACQSLRLGDCEMAIAGGVNVSIHPNKYLALGQNKFASSKGRCESFGQGGDGYVPGEGVGAVLLKPLSKAVADGDHIYGIIKGVAVNHGGKTNGFTVPNPNAQAQVIGRALEEAGIHPRTVSYLEAHGTGTSLGDPIEIAGLTNTFNQYTKDRQFCAIGSAKSNIGHCEAAAGIAGLTKVLMQLKHRQLVPSLHAEVINPNINMMNTPFTVQQKLTKWDRPVIEENGARKEYPRIAGISSFGAGGSNAHLIIQEYIPKCGEINEVPVTNGEPAMILLSAKTEEGLRKKARVLLGFMEEPAFEGTQLADLAYTLQVGREPMEERLAVMAYSLGELKVKLNGFLEDWEDVEDIYRGQVKRNKEVLAVFTADEDLDGMIHIWITKRKYTKLLNLWVKGLNLDWNKLYMSKKPNRISLPTYPFSRERYWLPQTQYILGQSMAEGLSKTALHPLLHKNTSDIHGLQFSSVFTGEEFFLADHRIKGECVLPGAACLEMTRAAAAQAAGFVVKEGSGICMKNIVWTRPIAVREQTASIHIALFSGDNGEIGYEIYGEPRQGEEEPVIYSEGSILQNRAVKVPERDLKALKDGCTKSVFSSNQCYEAFSSTGLNYGPGHRGIAMLYVGEAQVLARLSLPAALSRTENQFVLHPSLMDSALQATIGFMMHERNFKPALPYALDELEIWGPCTSNMWVWIQRNSEGSGSDEVQKFDIDLCNAEGVVCVRMKGFSTRVVKDQGRLLKASPVFESLMMEPCWRELRPPPKDISTGYEAHLVILCEMEDALRSGIEAHMKGIRCFTFEGQEDDMDKRFGTYAVRLFEEIKDIVLNKPQGNILIQVVVSTRGAKQLLAGLSGLLKTVRLENPKILGQLIEIEPGTGIHEVIKILKENGNNPSDAHVRYLSGVRYVAGWHEAKGGEEEIRIPWKDRGVYLITGGAGGLGFIFAKEIAARVNGAAVILTGRSLLDEERQAKIRELENQGTRIRYIQMDVTKRNQVEELIRNIWEEFGGLDGIIHSAGVIRDNFILKKSAEEFREVLEPKVAGLVHLDEASRDLGLDFFILFSSIAGAFGNPGQGDYASANAFMDAYAGYRNSLAAAGERHGQTLSVNWPLWKEGGMHVNEEALKLMQQNLGVTAMETSTGIMALYRALASGRDQVLVLEGRLSVMKEKLFRREMAPVEETGKKLDNPDPEAGNKEDPVLAEVLALLIEAAASLLNVKYQDIDADAGFNEYGLDQVLLNDLMGKLNRDYKLDLTHAAFLEYHTLQSFAQYLASEYKDVFQKQVPTKVLKESHNLRTQNISVSVEIDSNKDRVSDYIKKLLASVIKLPAQCIEVDVPLEKYGIDSIMVMQLTQKLEKIFGSLPKTLFFEYQSIWELAGYFMKNYPSQLSSLLGMEEKEPTDTTAFNAPPALEEPSNNIYRKHNRSFFIPRQDRKGRKNDTGALDIAIIGISGRYPGARNINAFWENLMNGKDAITEIPKERWDHSLYFDEDREKPGKTYSRWGGFIEGVDQFDPLFFNISPKEAELMDPQERLFLEIVFEALENAGYTRKTLQHFYEGRVGVYVGAMSQQYHLFESDVVKESAVSLCSYSSIANRVSHFFNFQGPSIAIDTMCSSSAIAVHLACESLIKGECRVAVAGGVNLSIHPKKYLGLGLSGMIGSHRDSRSFGDGDGYLPSEGVGAVILKPLSQAVKDRDSILAVIKSTATNHGGHTNGFFVPNPNAQARLMEDNFMKSGIDPRTISYIEAASNGSQLGDSIEVAALNKVFGRAAVDKPLIAIGSVKSNIGHAEAASGISQLTKVILQLKHKKIVPSIKAEPLNPNLSFTGTPFYLEKSLKEWERPIVTVHGEESEIPRRAAIHSFGAGGSNAHMIIEEYIPHPEESMIKDSEDHPQIIVFSAKKREQLIRVVQQMFDFVMAQKEISLENFAYTLQTGREPMEFRMALVVKGREELLRGMREYLTLEWGTGEYSIPLFTGDLEVQDAEVRSLLSGKVGETVIQVLMSQNHLEKLALHWAKGGEIPWDLLHKPKDVRRMALPTYPFARERYWISSGTLGQRETRYDEEKKTDFVIRREKTPVENTRNYLLQFLSRELRLAEDQIKLNKDIQEYGVDSLTAMKLIRGFEKAFGVKVPGREILKYRTIEALSTHLAQKIEGPREGSIPTQAPKEAGLRNNKISEYRDHQIIDALEKYKQGVLALEEIENLIEQGESL